MSAGWSIVLIVSGVGGALAVAYSPEPLFFLLALRLRVVDDPVRSLVVAHPNGSSWFVSRLPRKRS